MTDTHHSKYWPYWKQENHFFSYRSSPFYIGYEIKKKLFHNSTARCQARMPLSAIDTTDGCWSQRRNSKFRMSTDEATYSLCLGQDLFPQNVCMSEKFLATIDAASQFIKFSYIDVASMALVPSTLVYISSSTFTCVHFHAHPARSFTYLN